MHFCYIDETGCDGSSFNNAIEKPIFVLGGIIVRDEGWNKTHSEFEKIISDYFNKRACSIPEDFEFHTEDLFSPNGSEHFQGHSRDDRNNLIHKILDLISERKHSYYYFAIDKSKLNSYCTKEVRGKEYFDLKIPYLIAYDHLITAYERYTKEKLGKSARAMVILDEKDQFIKEIESVSRYRRFKGQKNKRTKWITEFSFAVDSKKNTMIQISDLYLYLTRKYLEIENGYRNNYSVEVKNIFRAFYEKIDSRMIRKKLQLESGRYANEYNDFIKNISSIPSTRWRSKDY